MKRLLAMLLLIAMVLSLIPTVFAVERDRGTVLTPEDYALADLIWDELYATEELMTAKRAPVSKTVEALIDTVTASPYYEEGSLSRNGDHFFWETVDGIACGYSPRMSAIAQGADIAQEPQNTATTLTYSYGTRASAPDAKDVYVIQPYYGIDQDFTTQYVTEARNIAKATGGTATVYRTTDATVDNIANALEQGAVVIFDSHGDTDYVNPRDEDDCATRANTSYICLQDGTGLTDEDMQKVSGPFGTYYNAFYGGRYQTMEFYYVNGTAIANHMEGSAPNSLLWMALCLGMATDGLQKPLMEKGVAVTYGYSQSVTFDYDYAWEEVFWSEMIYGSTVAESIAAMKDEVGCWDWCDYYECDTISEARRYYCAFPIVVSAEDPYPGHGNVDALQTVYSNWVLKADCPHSNAVYYADKAASCLEAGNRSYYYCEACQSYFADAELTVPLTMEEILLPAGHNYATAVVLPTCTESGYTIHICTVCGDNYTEEATLPLGHEFADGLCVVCGAEDPDYVIPNPFTDVIEGEYFYEPVLWAVAEGITTGMTATTFVPTDPCTRGQIVTFLWRAHGCPEPTLTDNPFTDVSSSAYYYKAVLWAVEEGITTGMSATEFRPESTCTRGQVATFLWRARQKPAPSGSENPFTDISPNTYYYNAVLWAVEEGITLGTGHGKFSPDDNCTRGQIVTFLYRALAKEVSI